MNQIESMKDKMIKFGKEYMKNHPQNQTKEQPKAKTEVKKDAKEKKNPFIVKRK